MKGKLNLFQVAMLRWRDLYPYNAVHVVRVSMPLDAAKLHAIVGRHLEKAGLTGLVVSASQHRYEWTGGPADVRVQVIAGGDDAPSVTQAEIERQLNCGFADTGPMQPFRFFAVDAGSSFDFGIAYDHFVAGGDSIARLLGFLVDSYCGIAHGGEQDPVVLYPPRYRHLFTRQAGALIRGLPRLRELIASCRRSARPRYEDLADGYNAVAFVRLDAPERERLTRTARAWAMTQNDLLLAILLRSLSACAPKRHDSPKRRELAVASIVNVRRDFGPAAVNGFVPMLASFRVAHPVPADVDLRELASFVHAETTKIKSGKLYLLTLLAIGLSGLEWRFLSPEKRRGFHAKHYPVWAGLTPLQVNTLWPMAAAHPRAPEYIRAVSTGPLSPLVVATTTLGEIVHVALSFRTTAFKRERIDELKAEMLRVIRSL